MKWILSILLFISATALGQSDDTDKYIWYKFQYGSRMPRFWADSVLKAAGLVKFTGIGTTIDTSAYKPLGINSSGSVVKLPGWPGSGGITDSDKGDIAVSSAGTVWTIDNNVVTNAKLAQAAALTIKGNPTNSTANVQDIAAATDNQVLRRSGTAIGFGTLQVQNSITGNGIGSPFQLDGDDAAPGTHKVYGTDASGVKGYQSTAVLNLTSPVNGQILAYDDGEWVNQNNTAVAETQIRFRVATDPAMAVGDSVYTDAALVGKMVKVYREGERMYPDVIYGIEYDSTTGTITFHPLLSAGEKIIIETSNYTTSSAVGIEDLDFPTAVSLTNVGTAWNATTGATMFAGYGLSNKKIGSGDDGYIRARYTSSDGGGAILAFNTSNTNEQYADVPSAPTVYNYEAGAFLISGVGTLYYLDAGVSSGAPVSTGVTLSTGDYFRIIRAGSVLKLQTSPDATTWTDRHTYTFSSTADLFINCNINDPNKLYEPKAFNVQ